ncbi:nuclear transport factor 2 family protein [Bacillus ndiopicus]|uniref:nuclear transport factor 2 family protein n=1 Tax=Bacillus ndiopicus TaxID=1347368 RepID=UPI0005A85C16|nr:nuclear transport factor 2 family protein [Bacillus ndiopicus]
MKKWLIMLVGVFMLTACGAKEEQPSAEQAADSIAKEDIGFEVMGDEVIAASDVPDAERDKIITTFNEYIEAHNTKDVDQYSNTLSKNATGFDYEKDLAELQKSFATYTIDLQAEDITIIKYDGKEAQVYANLTRKITEDETGTEFSDKARQVTVLANEDGIWKITNMARIQEIPDSK